MWQGRRDVGTVALAVVTSPLSALFGIGVRIRNLLFDLGIFRASRPKVPVVSVGNLAVGGTGKTPVAGYLVRELARRGWKPALVVRGYGEDEILLHRRWNPDVPVIRSPGRRRGVEEAEAAGRDVVVLDDGFQHRWVARDVDLVLLSPAQRLPVRLLPRGPFREPLESLRRAHKVWITVKDPAERQGAMDLASALARLGTRAEIVELAGGPWQDLLGEDAAPPAGPPFVVASIAEPESFARLAEARAGTPVDTLEFPDHHSYTREDAARIARGAGNRWIATTEKDAVKLVQLRELLPPVRVLPLSPRPGSSAVEALFDLIGLPGSPRRGS
jgi:tetraacyldisaccharide 4'-kinase